MEEIVEARTRSGTLEIPGFRPELDDRSTGPKRQAQLATHATNRERPILSDQKRGFVEERRAQQPPVRNDQAQRRADVTLGETELSHQLGVQDVAAIPGDLRGVVRRSIEAPHEFGNRPVAPLGGENLVTERPPRGRNRCDHARPRRAIVVDSIQCLGFDPPRLGTLRRSESLQQVFDSRPARDCILAKQSPQLGVAETFSESREALGVEALAETFRGLHGGGIGKGGAQTRWRQRDVARTQRDAEDIRRRRVRGATNVEAV